MLQHTFCHLPTFGPKKERSLWDAGVRAWHEFDCSRVSPTRRDEIVARLEASHAALDRRDGAFFGDCLPPAEAWRLFHTFRGRVAYVDIETTGMQGHPGDHITTVALYDGQRVCTYVHGRNLDDFPRDVAAYDLLVTYNGKCFDLPYLRSYFGIGLPQAHIDLRYTLARLGYKGGLKGCEKQLGLSRADTDGLDGYFAVLLWRDYLRSGDERTLDTLLAYNVDDVLSLECLMHIAWNQLVEQTPFAETQSLARPETLRNPFEAHAPTVDRLRVAMTPWWG